MKKIQTIAIVVVLLGVGFIVFQNIERGKEIQRIRKNEENYQRQLQDMKSDLIQYEFDSRKGLEEFLEQQSKNQNSVLRDVKNKLEEQDIKLKRIDQLIVSQISSVDTTYNKIVLDSIGKLFDWIKQAENGRVEIPFEDKTDCFEFKAQLVFEDGTTSVEVIERKYQDTIIHASTWERKQWKLLFIKSRFLGKKISTVEIFNNCGFSKVFTMTNNKANRKRRKN